MKKLALIITNAEYSDRKNRLPYSIENGYELQEKLENIGFKVTLRSNLDLSAMKQVRDFADKIDDGDLVVFYYCGHGQQMNGVNYLIPVDDERIEKDAMLEDLVIRVHKILLNLQKKNKTNATIMIFDCARPYFFRDSSSVDGEFIDLIFSD